MGNELSRLHKMQQIEGDPIKLQRFFVISVKKLNHAEKEINYWITIDFNNIFDKRWTYW